MEVLTVREELYEQYDNISVYRPFESETDKRPERDITYLICYSSKKQVDEISVYAPAGSHLEGCYRKIAYTLYAEHKDEDRMHIDYIHTSPMYRGLGIASMMIGCLKNECMVRGLSNLTLDSQYRYRESGTGEPVDLNHELYLRNGFEDDEPYLTLSERINQGKLQETCAPMTCRITGIPKVQSAQHITQNMPIEITQTTTSTQQDMLP